MLVAGAGLLAVVRVFLLRYVPDEAGSTELDLGAPDGAFGSTFMPGRSDLWNAFAPKAALMMACSSSSGWPAAGSSRAGCSRRSSRITAATPRRRQRRARPPHPSCPGRDDEFRELADAFDAMLERLERHVAEQQRFAANASHELRTPLAITQTLLDVAAKDPDPRRRPARRAAAHCQHPGHRPHRSAAAC